MGEINFKIPGRMLSGSKSGYSKQFPDNIVVFNANIVTGERKKIWYGDLDLTADAKELIKFAKEYGETLYVLWEKDGRFGNEANPKIEEAVAIVHTDGLIYLEYHDAQMNHQ